MEKVRLNRDAHTTRPWRIHDVADDFQVLDVWALPTPGGPDDFPRLITLFSSFDAERSSPVVRALFAARWALGRVLNLDGDGTGSRAGSLRDALPADLRDSGSVELGGGRFTPLYATDDEAAWEIVNRTVHGILHLGWVPDGSGGFRGQMAVLVKPNGLLGAGYLAAIAPFRHLVVYPTMLGDLERLWRDQSMVRQVEVPEDVRALSTLARIDYADAFLVDVAAERDWTAERWARAMLEEAPAATSARLLAGWTALGLKDGAAPSILGWNVRSSSAEAVLLGRIRGSGCLRSCCSRSVQKGCSSRHSCTTGRWPHARCGQQSSPRTSASWERCWRRPAEGRRPNLGSRRERANRRGRRQRKCGSRRR